MLRTIDVIIKAGFPGFSFSSDLFLVMGMWSDEKVLACLIMSFRLLHPVTFLSIWLVLSTSDRVKQYFNWFFENTSKDQLHKDFMRMYIPTICALLCASLCDVTLVQLFPWRDSAFYKESKGFPSIDLLRICLGVKSLQTVVSVVCQIVFLASSHTLYDPRTSWQAKVLFFVNIIVSVISVIVSLLMLSLKGSLLKRLQSRIGKLDLIGGSLHNLNWALYTTEMKSRM